MVIFCLQNRAGATGAGTGRLSLAATNCTWMPEQCVSLLCAKRSGRMTPNKEYGWFSDSSPLRLRRNRQSFAEQTTRPQHQHQRDQDTDQHHLQCRASRLV